MANTAARVDATLWLVAISISAISFYRIPPEFIDTFVIKPNVINF